MDAGSKMAMAALIFTATIGGITFWFGPPRPFNSGQKAREFPMQQSSQETRKMKNVGERGDGLNSFHVRPSSPSAGLRERTVGESPSHPGPSQIEKEILWGKVRETLRRTLYEKFPELRLSAGDLQWLTQNIRTVQESMRAMREIERTRERAGQIRNLRRDLEWNAALVQETLGMTVAEFIDRARDEKTIDAAREEARDEEISAEYLRDYPP
jgi:hypothetical protein